VRPQLLRRCLAKLPTALPEELPLDRTQPVPLDVVPEKAGASIGTILVVEDNAVNRMLTVEYLTLLGYTADVAENGKQALAAMQKRDFAAVLMDCHMPEMDGFQATEAIRRLERGTARRTPIIAVTADAFSGDEDRTRAAGMDDHLAKPVRLATLDAALRKWTREAKGATKHEAHGGGFMSRSEKGAG
jgi:CheY-like chemotaxis protein